MFALVPWCSQSVNGHRLTAGAGQTQIARIVVGLRTADRGAGATSATPNLRECKEVPQVGWFSESSKTDAGVDVGGESGRAMDPLSPLHVPVMLD